MFLRLLEVKRVGDQECDLALWASTDAVFAPTARVEQVRDSIQVSQ